MKIRNKKIRKFKGGGADMGDPARAQERANRGYGSTQAAVDKSTQQQTDNHNRTIANNKASNNTTVNTGNKNVNTGQKTSFMPFTLQIAKALVIDPLTKHSRTQKVKGESFFGKPKDLPASRDYYRTENKPIDVMSPKGVDYMKDAGLIKPVKTVKSNTNDGGGGKQQLCPDGTYPPCKLPTTQIKNPVTKPNTFLSDFQAYDDGGEVVISSNVDKSLL